MTKTKVSIYAAALTLGFAAATNAGGNPTASSPPAKSDAKKPRAGQVQSHASRSAELCQKQECVLEVTVDKCVVEVKPYVIVMTGKAPVKMVWRIRGGEFAKNPIRFKEAAAQKIFTRVDASAKEVVYNNNKKNGIWHYAIKATDGGKDCPELDPTGVNDMGTAGDPP